MSVFMESHGITYQGDGRTLDEIGRELGLTDHMIEAVQRDADKPDKIAMNIWRKLCPTIPGRTRTAGTRRIQSNSGEFQAAGFPCRIQLPYPANFRRVPDPEPVVGYFCHIRTVPAYVSRKFSEAPDPPRILTFPARFKHMDPNGSTQLIPIETPQTKFSKPCHFQPNYHPSINITIR